MAKFIEKLLTDHVVSSDDMAKKINEIIEFVGAAKPEGEEDTTARGSFKAGPVDRDAPSPATAHSPREARAPGETIPEGGKA